ncbi:uncharacterized protein BDV14DRAFT_162061 [Aspergillus stella-maris]|uniref:uncharacterized protein n=1 Tax=Aspergillus stella-maris TaxID=1810926 RepID=UPI003CCCBB6F
MLPDGGDRAKESQRAPFPGFLPQKKAKWQVTFGCRHDVLAVFLLPSAFLLYGFNLQHHLTLLSLCHSITGCFSANSNLKLGLSRTPHESRPMFRISSSNPSRAVNFHAPVRG